MKSFTLCLYQGVTSKRSGIGLASQDYSPPATIALPLLRVSSVDNPNLLWHNRSWLGGGALKSACKLDIQQKTQRRRTYILQQSYQLHAKLRLKQRVLSSRVADPDPVFGPGSGSGYQISLDPVTVQILEQKKRAQKSL